MLPILATQTSWRLRTLDRARAEDLVRAHRLHPSLAALLAARGILEHERVVEHLDPKLGSLHDPALLPGMRAATARLARAIEGGETILVHGDYDVDGVTGTTLLMRLFALVGARAHWHIPNRFTDGYAFGPHSIARAQSVGASVVISVDNGTSSLETIRELAALGIDTIVTDHHEPPESGELPPAVAIINPKLASSQYPFRELCGGAVAFKLAWGLAVELSGSQRVRPELRDFLVEAMAYVAIATVCDVVPLVSENRILARYGLRALESSKNPGLRALLDVAKISGQRLEADDVAFKIGPRINASGRLGSAHKAVELMLATDPNEARRAANELDLLNEERKRIELGVLGHALRAAEPFADREQHPVLIVAGEGWHQGVVGIVAARLVERFERPAVVIGLDGASGRGSARSVPGFSILEALHGGKAHTRRYGGHEQAAGLELETQHLELFRSAVCARAKELLGGVEFPAREILIDQELPFVQLDEELMRQIDRLRPFGEQNDRPVFLSCGLRLAEEPRIVGADKTHLQVQFRSGAKVLKGMAFGMAARAGELVKGENIHAVYSPKWNTFRGETKLEIELIDFRTGPRPAL
ncbi:MAG: single-stranded-DNA-specific exonuclease RecJ [Planctomycetes bacterium]|nr:single-stranded-DNA-specific exonuclease RecJ [Planctomycetota bacterium]